MKNDVPLWVRSERALRQYPWMDSDVRADACVIGGGITGVLCALRLTGEGRSVVLVTQQPIGYGATSRLLPCALCDSGQGLRGMMRRMGREKAAELLELMFRAADELEELCSGLIGGAGFARRDSVTYADSDGDFEQLRREYAECRRAGLFCSLMDRAAFGSTFAFPAAGALVMKDGAVELDPYLLTQRLAAEAADSGAIIFENTKADRIAAEKDGNVCVFTSTHHRIKARTVIIAAGGACAELTDGISEGRTRYAAASRPVRGFSGWPGKCVIRSVSEPGIICAVSPDERVVISSEASSAADGRERLRGALGMASTHVRRYEELEAAARYMFPEVGVSGYEAGWFFRDLRTESGLPVVGAVRGQPGCYLAAGGGAGGVLMSVVISRLLTDRLCGRQSHEMNIFQPSGRRMVG